MLVVWKPASTPPLGLEANVIVIFFFFGGGVCFGF